MKTKEQKIEEVDIGNELAKKSKSLIVVNFSDIPVNSINELKAMLRSIEAKIRVMKKTLFSIIFKKNDIDIDIKGFSGQIATIFSDSDIADTSSVIYKFSKAHNEDQYKLNMVAGYDATNKDIYNADKMVELGKLPSRDVLLSQLLGVLSAPMRILAVAIKEVATKIDNGKTGVDIKDESLDTSAEEKPQDTKNEAEHPHINEVNVDDRTKLDAKKNNDLDSEAITESKVDVKDK